MRILKYIVSAIAAFAMVSSVTATVLIDDYNTPIGGQSVQLYPPGGSAATGDQPAFVLGGSRDITVGTPDTPFSGVVFAGGTTDGSANLNGSGVGGLENSVVSQAAVRFAYDAFGAGLNLNAGAGEWFTFQYAADQTTLMRITLISGFGGPLASAFWQTPVAMAPGVGVVNTPTLGVAFAGVNLADIDEVRLTLLPTTNGGDVYVDNLQVVPEPTTYAGMFALGLAGFAAYRRFRQ